MTTLQAPIQSGFNAASTSGEVIKGIDLAGKTAIVTGGYSGLGLETVRTLRAAGAQVIVPARDRQKAFDALKGLDGIEIDTLDLSRPATIDAFAARFIATGRPLHLLINCAGIMACPLTRDERGYELQFATNHLGHFQLAARLWPALRQAGGARVVCVSSWGHRFSELVFDDPNFLRRDYDRWAAYGQSKTANILFALALDGYGKAHGVRAFSVHPGGILDTGLGKYLTKEELKAAGVIDEQGQPILDPAKNLKTVEQGASTIVWCATSPRLNGMGGLYCENTDVAALRATGGPADGATGWHIDDATRLGLNGVMPYAVDPVAAERLWQLSEQLADITFRINN